MAQPLDRTQLRGGNKSLKFRGTTFPVGPQTTTFQKPSGSGAIYLSTAGQVFEGYDCRGRDVIINADNITVRACLLNATSWYALNNTAGKRGLVVEFCMLDGEKANNHNSALFSSEAGDSIFRNNIVLDTPTDMVIMVGGTCEQNAFAGIFYQTGAHADGFSIGKSLGKMVYRENYVDVTQQPDSLGTPNSCIKVVSHFGPIDDVLIDNNILLGGGYNMYCEPSPHPVNNVRVTNNLYGLSAWGAGTEQGFIVGGGQSPQNGSNFQKSNNQQYATAPDDVVSVVGSGSQPPVEPGSSKPVNTTPPTIVPGPHPGTYTTASGTWSNVQSTWQWEWEWTVDGEPTGSEVVCTPAKSGQLVVAVSATTSDGQTTTVPSPPLAVTVAGEPPVDPDQPDDEGKYLSGDEIETIKQSLITIAEIIS